MPRTRTGSRIHVTGATAYLGAELLRRAPVATADRVEIGDAEAVRALLGRPVTEYSRAKAEAEERVRAALPDASWFGRR